LAYAGGSLAIAGNSRVVSDGALRVPLPRGWSGSVGPGFQGKHPVAWIVLGNFALASDAARREGGPRVPTGKALVTIGDFVVSETSRRWPVVRTLEAPRSGWLRVRFAGRAVVVSVRYGLESDRPAVARILAGVTRS
jgi:hypothetical protein